MELSTLWRPPVPWLQALMLFGVLTVAPCASADDDYGKFNSPFRVYLGGFWPEMNSEITINGDVLPEVPPIDVEDFLGVEDSKGIGWGGVSWHFAQRHSAEFEYFSLKRNGGTSGPFSPPIQVGDTFIEGGAINTSYNTSVTRLTYGFSVLRSERMDLQLKAGLHIANLEAGVQLAGLICDQTTGPMQPPGCPGAETRTAFEDVTAPLPHLGGSYTYIMTPSLAVNVQAMGFVVEIDSIDGSIAEITADVAWQPWQHVGFGASIRYFKTRVEAANSELNGKFEFEYLGPAVYVHATF